MGLVPRGLFYVLCSRKIGQVHLVHRAVGPGSLPLFHRGLSLGLTSSFSEVARLAAESLVVSVATVSCYVFFTVLTSLVPGGIPAFCALASPVSVPRGCSMPGV